MVGLLSVISALISLTVIWALAFIVDGVTTEGAAAFLRDNAWTLTVFLVLFAVVDPLLTFVRSAFLSQTVQTLLPAAMRWQGHKAVERQDVAFFEDLFSGQVASRIAQVTASVQRQLMVAMQTIPRVTIQFAGSFALLAVLAWPLAIPVLVWILANIAGRPYRCTALSGALLQGRRCRIPSDRRHDGRLQQHRHGQAVRG